MKQKNSAATPEYSHPEIEKKWQTEWEKIQINSQDLISAEKPFYNLMMFPYPSAEGLHVGNMYAFTGSDILGRFKRMQGYSVFEPIGLDGFGIHSENYAMKIGKNPMDHAAVTEKNFYRQMHAIGAMFDWNKTIETYNKNYYVYTQWIFLQLYKYGLVYRSKAPVNWCPTCKTVVSDEQVIDGKCERTGDAVIKKDLEQWFFNITAYAEKLADNIPTLNWSEKVKIAQTNWIGKKQGINITYTVVDKKDKEVGSIEVFTTRPDTNYGATFVTIAPEHPFITQLATVTDKKNLDQITQYVDSVKSQTDEQRNEQGREKTGVFTGLYCVNSLNGYKMPLYVSDFVLMGFGTGAVVGVPGHDLRDFEFAQKFNLPILRVVVGPDGKNGPITTREDVQEESGTMINSGILDGMEIQKAIGAMMSYLEEKGWGKRVTTYHLRDWLISRQRYWGPPIPMIFCDSCAKAGKSWFTSKEASTYAVKAINKTPFDTNRNSMIGITTSNADQMGSSVGWPASNAEQVRSSAGWYPVPESTLPIELPHIEDFRPGDDGIPPLAKHKEFSETTCPGCGGKAVRSTEVSDTFLDSSWYFLRYPSVNSPHSVLPWDPEITKKWLPVTMYTGGAEHSVLHLMYSRFITMALHDMGYIDFDEPFSQFYAHGLVIKDGAKMSKSKGNVVNPDEYIKIYGSDALRLYLMFMGPYNEGGDFRDSAMEGMSRWVGRVWRLAQETATQKLELETNQTIQKALHKLIKKVGEDTDRRHYNTAIASMMEFTNLVADQPDVLSLGQLKLFLKLLAPMAPHVTEELWQQIHGKSALEKAEDSIHTQPWPVYDPAQIKDQVIQIVIQINGKVRDKITVESQAVGDQNAIQVAAQKQENVSKYLEGKSKVKVIYVPGRIINFVVA